MHLSTIFDHQCPPACRWISHGSICELSCTSVHADEVFHVFPNSCGVLSVTPTGDLLQNRSQSQKTQWIYRKLISTTFLTRADWSSPSIALFPKAPSANVSGLLSLFPGKGPEKKEKMRFRTIRYSVWKDGSKQT